MNKAKFDVTFKAAWDTICHANVCMEISSLVELSPRQVALTSVTPRNRQSCPGRRKTGSIKLNWHFRSEREGKHDMHRLWELVSVKTHPYKGLVWERESVRMKEGEVNMSLYGPAWKERDRHKLAVKEEMIQRYRFSGRALNLTLSHHSISIFGVNILFKTPNPKSQLYSVHFYRCHNIVMNLKRQPNSLTDCHYIEVYEIS